MPSLRFIKILYQIILTIPSEHIAGILFHHFVKQFHGPLGIWTVRHIISKTYYSVHRVFPDIRKKCFQRLIISMYITDDRKLHITITLSISSKLFAHHNLCRSFLLSGRFSAPSLYLPVKTLQSDLPGSLPDTFYKYFPH